MGADSKQARENLIQCLEMVSAYDGEDAVLLFEDLLKERDVSSSKGLQQYNMTAFPSFNDESKGIKGGEIVLIGGGSSEGKSLFMHTLIDDMRDANRADALVLSFEQSPELILEKYTEGTPPPRFYMPRTHNYDTKYPELIEQMKADRGTYLGNLPSVQLQWLYIKLIECRAKKFNTKFVFIDYLHQLMDYRAFDPVRSLGAIMMALQSMAKAFKIVIFIVCHTTKESLEREPKLADLRDSGWIINVPDIIFLLWRVADESGEYSGNESILKIGKHRRIGRLRGRKYSLIKQGDYLYEQYPVT